tara:strand:+ start:1115 stop:1384 length:270 start_codon:yes stop_codon:yes gene_type:complete
MFITKTLIGFASILSICKTLDLPLENTKRMIKSSKYVLLIFFVISVFSETQSFIPAIIASMLYFYVELIPQFVYSKNENGQQEGTIQNM